MIQADLFGNFPVLKPAVFSGEVRAYLEDLASVCQKWPVIAFFVYLVEDVIWILVSFQFNDIYVFICLDEYVDAAIGRVTLDLNLLAH